jgi:hypothetical protein
MVSLGEGCYDTSDEVLKAYDIYQNQIKQKIRNTVWYDSIDNRCFGADLNYNNCDDYAESCFLASKEKFLTDSRHGLPYFEQISKSAYTLNNLKISEDLIIEDIEQNKKYQESTVLIIGAGPSVDLLNIEKVDRDYTWVCNDFLKHDVLRNVRPDLFYMSNEVYKKQENYNFMLKNSKCSACFDTNVSRDANILAKYKKANKENTFIFSSRMFTTIGTVPRLVNLACHMGAKKVKVVGLDGHSEKHYSDGRGVSAFEQHRKSIPKGQTYGAQLREYIIFWEHIYNKYPSVVVENLGKAYEHNVSKHVMELFK